MLAENRHATCRAFLTSSAKNKALRLRYTNQIESYVLESAGPALSAGSGSEPPAHKCCYIARRMKGTTWCLVRRKYHKKKPFVPVMSDMMGNYSSSAAYAFDRVDRRKESSVQVRKQVSERTRLKKGHKLLICQIRWISFFPGSGDEVHTAGVAREIQNYIGSQRTKLWHQTTTSHPSRHLSDNLPGSRQSYSSIFYWGYLKRVWSLNRVIGRYTRIRVRLLYPLCPMEGPSVHALSAIQPILIFPNPSAKLVVRYWIWIRQNLSWIWVM